MRHVDLLGHARFLAPPRLLILALITAVIMRLSFASAFAPPLPASMHLANGLSYATSHFPGRGYLLPTIGTRKTATSLALTSSSAPHDANNVVSHRQTSVPRSVTLAAWLLSISTFIVINLKMRPFPQPLLNALSRSQWSLLHALCSMLFGGTIIVTTLVENLVVASKKASVIKFWFLAVPRLDAKVVLPALSGSIFSGIGQATIDYGGLAQAPKYVIGAVHALLTFGLWWGLTDLTTQRQAEKEVQNMSGKEEVVEIPYVLKRRRWSNIVSCLMVAGLYALMVLKPGFAGSMVNE
mmetsp:Transcript_24557/g.53195  ORF Transcript_24557/g.53195 Transcript_24557/m.53195 type:complete len:296 (-) Transcript_24557:441-1328(-)